jgi:hypothetical protein
MAGSGLLPSSSTWTNVRPTKARRQENKGEEKSPGEEIDTRLWKATAYAKAWLDPLLHKKEKGRGLFP